VELSTFIKPALSIYGFLRRPLRKLLSERAAGQNPFAVPADLIEPLIQNSFRKLGAISESDPVWKKVGFAATGFIVRPQEFSKPHVREWLSDYRVQNELKSIVKAQLAGATGDPSSRSNLVRSYVDKTWENERQANAIITTAVAFLKASVHAATTDPAVAGIAQAGFSNVQQRFDELQDSLVQIASGTSQDSHAVAEHHRLDASAVLQRIEALNQMLPLQDRCFAKARKAAAAAAAA
jgi:hypothetical protein